MRSYPVIFLLAVLLTTGCSNAPEWLMVVESGEPPAVAKISDTAEELQPFTLLYENLETVNVEEHGYLKLADQNGYVAKFGPGSYSYAAMSKSFYKRTKGHDPLPKKYVNYIWSEMTKGKEETKVAVKPTVLRYKPKAEKGSKASELIQPLSMEIVSGEAIEFRWHSFGSNDEYLLAVKEVEGDWSKLVTVKDTIYSLDTEGLSNQAFYRVKMLGSDVDRLFFYTGS